MLPAAQPPAQQQIVPLATGDGIRAAHCRLAQLLHAAASIPDEINLEAAGGSDQPPTNVPAIGQAEYFEIPAEESRASVGNGSQMHLGNVVVQSQHAASLAGDAYSSRTAVDRPGKKFLGCPVMQCVPPVGHEEGAHFALPLSN
ncbi:unnamed protein product [Lampetra fluviatilis]